MDEDSGQNEAVLEGLKQLGEQIQRARKQAFRESRLQFAKRVGCSPMTLDRIERGDPGVSIFHVASALQAMLVLPDVVAAAAPNVLIATMLPATFPAGFTMKKSGD